jgi:hypothetical protein
MNVSSPALRVREYGPDIRTEQPLAAFGRINRLAPLPVLFGGYLLGERMASSLLICTGFMCVHLVRPHEIAIVATDSITP